MGSNPSALRNLVKNNDIYGVVEWLRSAGDRSGTLVDEDFTPDDCSMPFEKSDYNVLHASTLMNRVEIVRALLRHGANPNVPTRDNRQTALHLAARINSLKLTKALLRYGADLRAEDNLKRLPLHLAAGSPLAAMRNDASVLRHLVKCCGTKSVGVKVANGDTPLHFAAKAQNMAAVECLVRFGADVNAKNLAGKTPRDVASYYFGKGMDEVIGQQPPD